MRATRFISLYVLTVWFKTVYAGCLQTGHSDGDGRCDKDGDCCDSDAFCNNNNKCRFENGKSCDFSQQCDSTMVCYRGKCSEDIDSVSEKTSCESCEGNKDDSIDWECVLGKGALDEVAKFGGKMEPCDEATSSRPCTTFLVDKEDERAEVKINSAAEKYHMEKDEKWVIKYSFRPKKDMKVSKRFTHLGQIKPSLKDSMVGGDGLATITANNKGLHVRFSNQGGSIEDYLNVNERYIDWDYVTGKWVHVDIKVKFKNSMKVKLSVGDKEQVWEWPSHEDPVAWSDKDMDGVRMKLGVYHAEGKVGDAEVDLRDVAIIGPSGRPSRSSNPAKEDGCEIR
ncbi:unnamed protein product [Discosporangium mesarthrocarpum]